MSGDNEPWIFRGGHTGDLEVSCSWTGQFFQSPRCEVRSVGEAGHGSGSVKTAVHFQYRAQPTRCPPIFCSNALLIFSQVLGYR